MTHSFSKYLYILLLCSLSTTIIRSAGLIIPRSQSVNAARELVGWQQFINLADQECTYGAFSVAVEYQQSFRGARLMKCLFDGDVLLGNSTTCCSSKNNTASLLIQGSRIANASGVRIARDPRAWLADYFGLSPNFESVVAFAPQIRSGICDFNAYVGLDEWAQGLFVRIHAPLVWTNWNLCASENITADAGFGFDNGYMNANATVVFPGFLSVVGIPDESLRKSFLSAIDGTYTFGDMQSPLAYGTFCQNQITYNANSGQNNCTNCSNLLVRLADIEAAFGYNFLLCQDYHLGLELRGSAPAGNKPCGKCLFEPIIGNGKYWTLGAGLTAHSVLWRDCECPDRTLSIYIDANVNHLFKSCQIRSFDLIGKPNSRYMLVEQFTAPYPNNQFVGLFAGDTFITAVAPASQYSGTLLPLINLSTFNVNSSFAVQADIALKLSYMTPNWDFDLGYEFWGRSKEKTCLKSTNFAENTYALKGDAYIYGFGANDAAAPITFETIVALSATQSAATIHAGTIIPIGTVPTIPSRVNNGDSPIGAFGGAFGGAPTNANQRLKSEPNQPSGNATVNQNTSATPIFISIADFDLNNCSGSRSLTHKIFANISSNWDCDCLSPFLGVGTEIEFAPCAHSCKTNCALSQWGIWVKGGLGF